MAELDAAGDHDVAPGLVLGSWIASTGSPRRTEESRQPGSVIDEVTTYFCKEFSESAMPVVSSSTVGQ